MEKLQIRDDVRLEVDMLEVGTLAEGMLEVGKLCNLLEEFAVVVVVRVF
jgi:hypothetical protein